MYQTTIKPDFNKLKAFFPNITDEQILLVERSNGVPVNLEHMDEAEYLNVSQGLISMLERYNLAEHYNELLYLILSKNEDIAERYLTIWQNYTDDQTSRELAVFLLAYKTSKTNQPFQLTAKSFTTTATIKSTPIARWMADTIYNAIERQEFPLGVFGTKVMFDLFGNNPFDVDSISIERLEATAKLNPRKPTVKLRKLYVEFCKYIQLYLISETHLTLPEGMRLTDAHANLFFDLLELLGFYSNDDIQSEPKDYMHAMFRNTAT
jgi:hypothetical protein